MNTYKNIPDYVDSLNYAIFFLGASKDDNFNEQATREHLFKLRELIEQLSDIVRENQNQKQTRMNDTELTAQLLPGLPEEIILTGKRVEDDNWIRLNGEFLDIRESLKIYEHSSEFNWGYEGSGPTQLALAILLKFLPFELAQKYKHDFKRQVIAKIAPDSFSINIDLRKIISEILHQNT